MPAIGEKAPDFTLLRDGGDAITLSALRPDAVVVYFYPKDATSGCTTEALVFTAALPDFRAAGARVLGVSRDDLQSHEKFVAKHNLGVPLLADADGQVTQAYGVWVEKNMYGRKYMGIERATYLIDGQGVIRDIWRKVRVKGHVAKVLDAVRAL